VTMPYQEEKQRKDGPVDPSVERGKMFGGEAEKEIYRQEGGGGDDGLRSLSTKKKKEEPSMQKDGNFARIEQQKEKEGANLEGKEKAEGKEKGGGESFLFRKETRLRERRKLQIDF